MGPSQRGRYQQVQHSHTQRDDQVSLSVSLMTPPRSIWCVLMGCLLMLVAGCVSSKFSATRRADLREFSDRTSSLLGDSTLGYADLRLVRLRDLLEPSAPEETRLLGLMTRARTGRLFFLDFSLRLSRVSADASKKEQAAYIADLVHSALRRMEAYEALPEDVLDVPDEVRAQPNLQRAAAASIPVIHLGAERSIALLSDIDEALEALVAKLERKIDERHATTLRRARGVQSARDDLLDAIESVFHARRGDEDALASLHDSEAVALCGGMTGEDGSLADLQKRLIERVDWVDRVKKLIKDDLEAYREDHIELDRVHLEMRQEINSARTRLIVWMMAYARMASGVMAPAEWFDIADTPALLRRLGGL